MSARSTTIIGVTSAYHRGDQSCFFGRARYRPGGSCGPRVQHHFQIIILLQGSMHLRLDGSPLVVPSGHGILLAPGHSEMMRFPGSRGAVHTWCEIHPRLLSPAERRILRSSREPHPVSESVHRLIDEGLSFPVPSGSADLLTLCALARACMLRFSSDALRQSSSSHSSRHPAVVRALQILFDPALSLSSASDLALRSGISLSRLRQLFRDAGLEAPSSLLWRHKAERAIQLIHSTGLSLAEISAQCGYANPFHLSRSVKQHTGLSPRALRLRL